MLASHGLDCLQDDPEMAAIDAFVTKLCNVPMATVSVVEEKRQWFRVREGIEERETPHATSFCAHAMLGSEPMVITNTTKDPCFAQFASVTGPEHIRFYAGAPILAEGGTPIGALCAIDTVPRPDGLDELQRQGLQILAKAVASRMHHNRQRLTSESELEFSQARLRTMIDSVLQIAWSMDSDGRFDYFNARWEEVTGAPAPAYASEWEPYVHPDDFAGIMERWALASLAREPFEGEYRLRHRDGNYRWVLVRALVISSKEESEKRWCGMITDVDEAHRQSEGRHLLARELSHRIKNIFAVVSGLISLTSRARPEAEVFAEEMNSKIRALGRAHDFVRPIDNDKGDSLHGLLEVLMKPYADAGQSRVTVHGDEVMIGVKSATPLALVFHEFATNAAKYGAFSVREGKVNVSVKRGKNSAGNEECAIIEWRESGGPKLETGQPIDPAGTGFGTRLVEMTITGQLRGELQREMRGEGFMARLTIPLSSL
jgi:PAS domain S-box-containing protein